MSHFLKGAGRLLLLLVATTTLANPSFYTDTHKNQKNHSREAVVNRLKSLDLPLRTSSSDAHLQRKIKEYLRTGGRSTERMLGRANQYFPVFEYFLAKHDMPSSLKYLAVAESMLVPAAVSSARAAGLWQLMPATAREMGLRVDGTVDERLDIHRSTEAAVLVLKDLYAQYGDWHLALAAYNCGSGCVRRAIRRAGGYTFYPKVKPYLPQESQNYVAAYVAAAYAVNYYDEYGLTPRAHDEYDYIRVYRNLSLYRLARATETKLSSLRRLNPSFVRGIVPTTSRGYLLRVPQAHKYAIQQYVWGRPNLVALPTDATLETANSVATLTEYRPLAVLLGCFSGNLVYQLPPRSVQRWEEAMLLDHLDRYRAVAMN